MKKIILLSAFLFSSVFGQINDKNFKATVGKGVHIIIFKSKWMEKKAEQAVDSVTKEEPFHKLDKRDKITEGKHKVKSAKQKKRIVLTDLGITVLDYLLKHFSEMICIEFTANVETDLDLISKGETDFNTIIKKI